ncbi:MAG: aminopeptidase N [Gammaproteobacteria bacterium]|nr:aminopeptidase N [Gammaproteobacteria bacterium]
MTANSQGNKSSHSEIKYRRDYKSPAFFLLESKIYLKLSEQKTTVISSLNFKRNLDSEELIEQPRQLILNGVKLKLLDISLDGVSMPRSSYQFSEEYLLIQDLPDQFTLEITTEINPQANTSLQGLYKSGDKYCTQCEAEGFRNITYFPDRPDVMTIFTTKVEADKTKYPFLLSNGNLIDSGDLENGKHFATWHDPFPKPSYLFALVAGNFDLLEDTFITMSGREVALKIYVDSGKLNQCHHAMESLKKAMTWDEEVYGLEYDLDIYMIVAVSDFNMGAMENKGLNVFNTCFVLANNKTATDADFEDVESVIAHEYFHNWTGNRVTCRDWFQLTLKEGLTVFRDQEFSSDMNSRAVKRLKDVLAIKNGQFAEDAGPMSHPIRPDSYVEMNNFYTQTVYSKGAEVIRMIETIVCNSGFKKGMKLYFERHDGQAVTCEDFICAMEDANNVDLSLFRNWYRQAGTPELDVNAHWDSSKGKYTLTITQYCKPTPGQPHKEPFLIPLRLALFSKAGEMQNLDIANSDIKCKIVDNGAFSGKEAVIEITEHHQTIVFSGLNEKPIPSLLRGFSAPIKLHFGFSDQELALLLAFDNDSYSSWEAGQMLMTKLIVNLTGDLLEDKPLSFPIELEETFNNILEVKDADPNLLAMNLSTPSLDFLLEQFQEVPWNELVNAYNYFNRTLAIKCHGNLLSTYDRAASMADSDRENASGWRKLQNACLSLLGKAEETEGISLAIKQFKQAKEMTNSLASLKVVAHSQQADKTKWLDTFYQRWQDEELVLDKWFSVQATNPERDVINEIYQLLEHADFQISNPNKVRALITAFAKGNLENFHRLDGVGYKLVADVIIKLNKINPQIAARLTSSFNSWRKFDNSRKELMKHQLKRIVELENVSADVYEIASKALAYN